MASLHFLSLISVSLLLLCHASLAQFGSGSCEQERSPWGSQRRCGPQQSQCHIERLNAQEPSRHVQSEAGLTEYFDLNNEQFECVGVAAYRRTIHPGGLLLPSFFNAPALVYILQGKGINQIIMPGCPETFQSFQQHDRDPGMHGDRGGQTPRDQHQKIGRIRQGDVIAVPAGAAHWVYNDGDQPLVAFAVLDTLNNANQLDPNPKEMFLAGRKQKGQRFGGEPTHGEDSSENILSGFETETLAEALGISRELAEKLKNRNDNRGEVIRVEGKLQVLRPSRMEDREEYEYDHRRSNGLEQAFCSMRTKHNIDDPRRADIYNPNAGRTTTLNSQKLTILRYLQLNAVRGVLQRNAFVAPHWNMNAHSIMYVTGGSAEVQIVGNRGNTAFNGELRRGQLIVVPQNFAFMIQARSQGFEWVAIKTNDNTMISPIVGKTSILKGMPEEVLRNAYRISREEARRLKYNRGEEMVVFEPSFSGSSRGRADA